MKNLINRSFGGKNVSFATKLTVVAGAVLILVACGGGGGGGAVTPPPTTFTSSIVCPDGVAKSGTSTVSQSAALDAATAQCSAPTLVSVTPADKSTNASPDDIAVNGIVVATSSTLATPAIGDISLKIGTTNVPVTVTMSAGSKGFKFVPATKLLFAQAYNYLITFTDTLGKKTTVSGSFTTASVQCIAPQTPNSAGTACVDPAPVVLHYTDKVYALWTDKYPFVVTKNGVVRVKNMTVYNGLGKDLFLCFMANHALADGKILTLCKDLGQLKWHLLYIDATKEELYEYTGTPPADLVYTVSPEGGILAAGLGTSWLDVDKPTSAHPQWNSFAKVTDGYYYTEVGSSGGLLKFIGNNGVISVVADKDPLVNGNGTIRVMWGYSN